jgi:hypothetical protein
VRRWILAVGLLLAAVVLAGRADRPSAAPSDPRPSAAAPAPTFTAEPSGRAGEAADRPLRDLFRYADEVPAVGPARVVAAAPRPPAPTASPEAPVRLVGIVRQSGGLRAALAIRGEVVLLRPGEAAEGWTLVALGETEARLRGPDGHEETVPLPE